MKINNRFLTSISLLICLVASACYYDNKEELYDYVLVEGDTTPCEVLSASFTADIFPIVDLQCNAACHNATDRRGNIVLETHGQIMPYINDGSFLGSIKFESPFVPMPPGAKMSTCSINKIEFWINDGAPNN